MPHLTVMLPAIDEAEGAAEIIPRIPHSELEEMGWDVSILVVDGGSSDETVSISKALGAEVIKQQGTGKGAAMRLGFLHFLKSMNIYKHKCRYNVNVECNKYKNLI